MTKQERKRARHARRVSRRTLLKGAGAAAIGAVASLFIPRMAHAVLPKPLSHPHWDLLLDHIDRNPIASDGFGDGRLRSWVHDLALQPNKPQRPLLLTGAGRHDPIGFQEAMHVLLPYGAVVYCFTYPNPMKGDVNTIRGAWLMCAGPCSERYVNLIASATPESLHCADDRYLKWLLTRRKVIDPAPPNVIHFHIDSPAIVIPKPDLIRRLEDERDAFQHTLRNYAA